MSENNSIRLTKTVFQDLIESLNEEFGEKSGLILHNIGSRSGRRSAEKRLIESQGKKKKAIELLFKLKHEQNWADIKLLEFDINRKTGKISVKNCFEATSSDESPKCNFTSGFLCGFLSTVLNDEVRIPSSNDNKCVGSCERIFWAI